MEIASLRLRLSAQQALLGQVSPNVYGVCVRELEKLIVMTFYVAADLSENERDNLTAASTMVIADFPDDFQIREDFRVAAPEGAKLRTEGTWVHLHSGFGTVEA